MNLDAMSFEELDSLWREVAAHPRKTAFRLFPGKPQHYVKTAQMMGVYASDRIRAMQYRAAGHEAEANKIEGQLATLYSQLPAYAQWSLLSEVKHE